MGLAGRPPMKNRDSHSRWEKKTKYWTREKATYLYDTQPVWICCAEHRRQGRQGRGAVAAELQPTRLLSVRTSLTVPMGWPCGNRLHNILGNYKWNIVYTMKQSHPFFNNVVAFQVWLLCSHSLFLSNRIFRHPWYAVTNFKQNIRYVLWQVFPPF